MKKRILALVIFGITLAMSLEVKAQTKIGFNTADAFDVSGNSVAHYGMSVITGVGYHYVGLSGYFGLNFYTEAQERMKILRNGNVGIGTSTPTAKITVAGNILSQEVKVTINAGADFVFNDSYKLPSLDFLEKNINQNKHLPEIASAEEMKNNGVNIGEFQIQLLQKIEELTLYTIQQQKEIEELKSLIKN